MKQYSTTLKCKLLFAWISVIAGLAFAPSVFAGSATLTWNANTEPDLAGYRVYYATSSHSTNCPAGFGANWVTPTHPTSTTYTFNNLTNGQTYYFQVTAYDASNNISACSAQVSKVITVPDTTPPVTTVSPNGGAYATAQMVTATVNETAVVYYTTNGSTPTASSTYYTGPINIAQTTTLKYFAQDIAGNNEVVQTQIYEIAVPDTTPPVTTVSLNGGTYSSAQVTLSANEPATIYYTIDGSTPTASSSVYATPIDITTTTTLRYFAKDTAGNSETVKTQTYVISGAASDATPPTTPASLVATAVSTTQVDLSWNASTDNVGVSGYRIYRDGFQKMTTTNTQYSDTGLSPSTAYVYKVLAFDAAGNLSGFTANVPATTQALPATTPSSSGGGGGGGGWAPPAAITPVATTTQTATTKTATTTTALTPVSPAAMEARRVEQAEQRGQATASTATEGENKYAQFGSYITKKHLVAGSKGSDVEMLQKYLQIEGYLKETPTGYYGKTTQDAVQKFQQEHGISGPGKEGYGEIGVKTRTVINQHLSQANTTQGNGSAKATGKSLTPEMRKKITDLIAVLQKQLVILLQQLAELMKAQKK